MKQDVIEQKLKAYQVAENDPRILHNLTREFLSAINPRILAKQGILAKYALWKVLEDLFAIPTHPILSLRAMSQLCRDNPLDFHEVEDDALVQSINCETYFSALSLDRFYVETQDGVV